MSRSVSTLVYWLLSAFVWTAWFAGMGTVYGWTFYPGPVFVPAFLWMFGFEVVRAAIVHRRTARRAGRSAIPLRELAGERVDLPAVPANARTVRRFAFDLGFACLVLAVIGLLFGYRPLHFLPLGLPLLAVSAAGRLFVPTDVWGGRPFQSRPHRAV